jgi:hypothetical protein
MKRLKELVQELTKELEHAGPEHVRAAQVASKAIQVLIDKHRSLGDKAEDLVDDLCLALGTLPAKVACREVVTILKPHLGDAVDWAEGAVGDLPVVDNQDGPVVHDDGQDAPTV